MKKLYILTGLALLLGACQGQKVANTSHDDFLINGKMYAAFFQQQAAEYDALCYQAFNVARLRLDEALSHPSDKPIAIVSDIDETFMNTSYYAVE